jgi:cytochrome c oxidase assembly protein subunit 15
MAHRYFASLVGAMVLAIAIKALRTRRKPARTDDRACGIGLPIALLLVVVLQGLFGKWTVTFLLKPAIVTLHLLGGMTLVALLSWLCARHWIPGEQGPYARALRPAAACALILLSMQIALGGWVSTNYAALACVDFPTCHGAWKPPADFYQAFHFLRDLGQTTEGYQLSNEALNAIQWSHRLGALITFVATAFVAARAIAIRQLSKMGWLVLILLCLQVALGITNVLAGLPLAVAIAHNGVAALLLTALVMLNFATRLSSASNR